MGSHNKNAEQANFCLPEPACNMFFVVKFPVWQFVVCKKIHTDNLTNTHWTLNIETEKQFYGAHIKYMNRYEQVSFLPDWHILPNLQAFNSSHSHHATVTLAHGAWLSHNMSCNSQLPWARAFASGHSKPQQQRSKLTNWIKQTRGNVAWPGSQHVHFIMDHHHHHHHHVSQSQTCAAKNMTWLVCFFSTERRLQCRKAPLPMDALIPVIIPIHHEVVATATSFQNCTQLGRRGSWQNNEKIYTFHVKQTRQLKSHIVKSARKCCEKGWGVL